MARLVVISNRVADPRKVAAGGLAVALGESLQQTGGLWFGWSGTIVEDGPTGEGELHRHQAGKVTLATLDLCREDHDAYYLGYSNKVLWPVFHNRLDLANFDAGFIGGYRRVNQLFARKLMPLLQEDDILWVHDYHLIPLAAELRAMGCKQKIGFFLHIPLPPQIILAAIPQHEWLMRSLFAYDVVGFQAQQDVQHFERYVSNEAHGEALGNDQFRAWGQTVRASAFPIGIDVDEFLALTHAKEARDMHETVRREYSQRRLLLGIDRLDYSKGIPQRARAFRELLARYPENHRSATLIQIASPTREDVDAYGDIRRELESLCGAINGDYGELDWMPVRYIHRTVARKRVPGLCRAAAVGLVTPLRDGMNLVAKEYIAAQDPADPGVLVLSRFAGAAEQLKEALLVNPYDTHGTAETIQQALHMPLEERRARHQKLLSRIREHDVHWWRRTFLDALREAPGVG
ncbi:alpha,alpha-trehalose-phosphate synthase (UDP-forming) [Pseudacidovorax intermedius]|uniref:Trehalose-6-phosphate synthase n=1 Tax=Pseudacidovorax intermedius TaxID=433924 RepID=A0A370FKQ8_9BURK|nr:alpha,alpha-trehalose-phosphate synthase (UDP-forming) [Pseudacidovorax intermedius]RDI28277.1 trehalose 6-phosphate synthase [Pseudacidovorax intermedius]